MEDINRRSAMALGVTVAVTPLLAWPTPARAETYGPEDGKELFPGVRLVDLGKRESMIPAYKNIAMADLIFQPGGVYPEEVMKNDSVCHVTEGELQIKQGSVEFTCKKGDVYSCVTGSKEQATNAGSTAAVMRAIDLLTT